MGWPVNDKIYFFKGSIYWKFDPDKSPPVDSSYPRPISNWDGIPEKLDSALQYSNGSHTSSRMVVTTVSTTKTLSSMPLRTHPSLERLVSGGLVAQPTASD